MIISGNILTYLGINILVLKLIVLSLPMDFFSGLLHNLSVNDIGASIFKTSCSVLIYYGGCIREKAFIFRVQCITIPFVGFQACAITSNFMFQPFCINLASGIL